MFILISEQKKVESFIIAVSLLECIVFKGDFYAMVPMLCKVWIVSAWLMKSLVSKKKFVSQLLNIACGLI